MRFGQEKLRALICTADTAQRAAAQRAAEQWVSAFSLWEAGEIKSVTQDEKVLLLCSVQEWTRGSKDFKKFCENENVLIILMGELREKERCICGLKMGADDYVLAPYEADEFAARIQALLRRAGISFAKKIFCGNKLYISLDSYCVCLNDIQLDMPPKEMELLYFLAVNQGSVFTRHQLMEKVWGFSYFGGSRTVDVHIKRLREKMRFQKKWKIETVWGIGYKLEEKEGSK